MKAIRSLERAASAGLVAALATACGLQPVVPVASAPISVEAADALYDRVAVKGNLAGAPQDLTDGSDVDGLPTYACAPPGLPVPAVARWNAFFSGEIGADNAVALHQITIIYGTIEAANQALIDLMDAYGQCDRQVAVGEITDGFAPVDVPDTVKFGARAIRATMDNGSLWHHRYGCVAHRWVMQCVAVWSRSDERSQDWLEAALAAIADRLRQLEPVVYAPAKG